MSPHSIELTAQTLRSSPPWGLQSDPLITQGGEALRTPGTEISQENSSSHSHSEHPPDDSLPLVSQRHYRRYFWDKIGRRGLFIFGAGSLLLLATFTILLCLWLGAQRALEGDDPGTVWQSIVFSGWITRVVTISAAMIRTVITTQAAIMTAMIAALFLESAGTTLHNLPILSITRAVNISPTSLLKPGLLRLNSASSALYTSLIITTSLLVVFSQFISTFLVSDFASVSIAAPNVSTMLNTTSSEDVTSAQDLTDGINFFGSAPSSYWRFAEYHEPLQTQPMSVNTTFTDTGVTFRAAVPFVNQTSRLNLQYYSGLAQLWDARVVCLRPTLSSATFVMRTPAPYLLATQVTDSKTTTVLAPTDFPYVNASDPSPTTIQPMPTVTFINVTIITPLPIPVAIQGTAHYSDLPPSLKPGQAHTTEIYFNCTIAYSQEVCISTNGTSTHLSLDTILPLAAGSDGTAGFMVINVTLPKNETERSIELQNSSRIVPEDDSQSNTSWSFQGEGPWTKVFNQFGQQRLALSACYTRPLLFNFNITMSGSSTTSEPSLSWIQDPRGMTHVGSINTLPIRRQLGATLDGQSIEERGILSLNVHGVESQWIGKVMSAGLSPRVLLKPLILADGWKVPIFYRHLTTDQSTPATYQSAHDVHSALFLDILKTTSDPALATQALSTVLYQMQYFDRSYKWDVSNSASYIMSRDISIPVRRAGLLCLGAIITVHLGALTITSILFLSRTQATLLGNGWQSVAQIVSDPTSEILALAGSMKDDEVVKTLIGPSQGGKEIGVVRKRYNGRNQFGLS